MKTEEISLASGRKSFQKFSSIYFNISWRVQMIIFCNEPSSNDVVRGDLSVYVP